MGIGVGTIAGPTTTDEIRSKFCKLTGLSQVEIEEEQIGPETFLRFRVGQNAPLYKQALAIISREMSPESDFHGRLTLNVVREKYSLKSRETDLLRSLIARSLTVTSDQASKELTIEFVPFRGGEEQTITQATNHVILGRRGVGKSSLILLGVRTLRSYGEVPVWIDLEPYRGRRDPACVVEILREVFKLAVERYSGLSGSSVGHELTRLVKTLSQPGIVSLSQDKVEGLLPDIRGIVRHITQATGKQLYVFLDDAHKVSSELQPFLFDAMHSVLKGAGGWLNVASVKHLTRLRDPGRDVGLQVPHDAQLIDLDLTLTDPKAARDHLVAILDRFLSMCGINRRGSIIAGSAVERLVWCSAGVPRDFLSLFQTAIQHALQNHRSRVGVQEVNIAAGESGQTRMQDLANDTTENAEALRAFLDGLQHKCLDDLGSNSFLARHAPRHVGYEFLQKLMDLRLIHLLHPSITPGKAGERYEAYLLDYSFYTGVRRRHGLKELKISSDAPPRYAELRKLPRIDVERLVAESEPSA